MPGFACTFRIAVVLFEKSERFAFAGTDYDLSLFSGFNRTAFVVYQVNVILRVRQSHTSRFRFHPRHGGDSQGRFCLSETFHQFDAGQFLERLEYGRIQGLAGNRAVFE